MSLKPYLLILPALMVAACSNDNSSGGSHGVSSAAVVSTASSDFQSEAVSLVENGAPYTADNELDASSADVRVRADGDHFFLIKRFGTDQIQRYQVAAPTTPVYTYSTNDSDGSDSNPYDLVIASETKGYLIRYGSNTLWIVNPSATSEAAFKTGEIDLSAYASNGAPQMSAGLIKNGKLYVAMQRLDQNFAASQNGYVAVIDITTDQEIVTGDPNAALKGIALPVRDPYRLLSVPGSDAVLVGADGGFDGNFNQQYDGGIVSIDPDHSYATTLLLDDGDDSSHPYGAIDDISIAAADRMYFIGSTGFAANQTVYRFNPAGSATPVAVSGFSNLALGPISTDANGDLWVGQSNSSAPGLSVLGFSNGADTVINPLINTVLMPLNIDFVTAN